MTMNGTARLISVFVMLAALPLHASASDDAAATGAPAPTLTEHVQVTATRLPESTEQVPASITVLTRDDLVLRGARDLTSALALVAGISIAPGGDGGPASSVPEFWGLREFDAFLLTVDGVPWGGAFAPALPTLDLSNVDRIEVLRGAAPVMYGATSFVGVINVIRRDAGEG
jgi:outer membrane receptor protein involved in Fe transport